MSKLTVKRSYRQGSVGLGVTIKMRGYDGSAVSIDTSHDVSADEARAIAAALIDEANRVDAVVAKKAAEAARRGKWREREIVAGRMKSMSVSDFLSA